MNRTKLTRRRLLHYSACCGGLALLGGVWTGQRLYGRSALKKTRIGDASIRLAAKNDEEPVLPLDVEGFDVGGSL